MSPGRRHSSPTRGDGLQSDAEKRPRPSLSVRTEVRATSPLTRYHNQDTDVENDDGFDSDATIDLDKGLLSPALEGAPPLQRMSSDYERMVLRSLRHGKATAYACSCSIDLDKTRGGSWQHIEWASASSESDSDYESCSDEENEVSGLETRLPSHVKHSRVSGGLPSEISNKEAAYSEMMPGER